MDVLLLVLPGEVRNLLEGFLLPPSRHQLAEGLFRRIAPDHEIHLGITDQLFVEVGSRISPENDRNPGVVFLTKGGHLHRTVGMREPVEVDTEHARVEFGNHPLRIEILILQHPEGQVDDSHPDSVPLQVLGNGREPHRVHLKDGSRRNQVADGPEKDGKLPKIIHRRGVKKDQIRFGEHRRKAFQQQRSGFSRQRKSHFSLIGDR